MFRRTIKKKLMLHINPNQLIPAKRVAVLLLMHVSKDYKQWI